MHSMTGFGRGTCAIDGREITIELRSVNHKFLDLGFRMPRTMSFLEEALRNGIASRVSRGHIDVVMSYINRREDAKFLAIDEGMVAQYISIGNKISEQYGLRNDMSAMNVVRLPEVITVTENEDDLDAIREVAMKALEQALDGLILMREREGENLKADIRLKLTRLHEIRLRLLDRSKIAMVEYTNRLEEKVAALVKDVDVDQSRLATEVAIMADRSSIDEELVRIQSHIANISRMMEDKEPVGRRMDFLIQEMNREFNTTGSKSTDVEIAKYVIDGKAEIEKIREQVQNIE